MFSLFENISFILLFLLTWHIVIMSVTNTLLSDAFIENDSDLCICGLDIYKNIYYICSNNPLKNYIHYYNFNDNFIGRNTIPRDFDPYSLIMPPILRWGKFICMRNHI